MTTPALEGLSALLEKNPIVPTFKARDLMHLPEHVEAEYERHVRTYLPFTRGAESEDAADLGAFEHRLLRLIREAKAPLGYVAAEYGHGKTSTGLFLWDRARQGNILAVPPFSLDRLEDLLPAVAGWVRFMVGRVAPGMAAEVDAAFQGFQTEGVEALARQHAAEHGRPYEQVLAELRALDRQGRLHAQADGLAYVNFLGAMTELARKAGYDGLLVVADEVQQFVSQSVAASADDAMGRLFDLITTLYSRTGRLACGLILLLPNKELGLLNQQRGDLVQRVKAHRLALDLTQVYGPSFAADLWQRLAETFHFTSLARQVIEPEALRALGEIAARTDLASGPRTVVDMLKLAAARHQSGAAPYGLLDLVGSFERGEVAFDGTARIQAAVRGALVHDLVRGNPERERAVRLMAAFPTSGLSLPLQEQHGVRDAVDDLQRLGGGDLTAIRGGGYDHAGRAVESGVTLLALRPAQEQVTWLKTTIRDFRRRYFLGSTEIHRLAATGFLALLTSRLFPQPAWRIEQEFASTALSQNAGVLLRGTFPSMARRFPDRLVYVRLLQPEEHPRDPQTSHDVLIDIALLAPHDADVEAQRDRPGRLVWLGPNHARVELNLLRRQADAVYLELSPGFEDIVAPYDVNALLNLSLYAHLARALASGAVPGAEESNVRDLFLPALHTAVLRDLLTAEVGTDAVPPVSAAELRFFDALVKTLCERTYGDSYVTLMVTSAWKKALEEYKGALQKVNNPYVQNGNEQYQGSKKDVATLLTRTNATLDNFITSFPDLIKVETPFKGDAPGAVRFTLHPLEQRIVGLVQAGEKVPRLNQRTGRAMETPVAPLVEINRVLTADGYRSAEIEAGIDLLQARRMIDWDQRNGRLALAEPDVPSLDIVRAAAEALVRRIDALRPLLSETFLRTIGEKANQYQRALTTPSQQLTGSQLLSAKRQLDDAATQLTAEQAHQREIYLQRARELESPADSLSDLDRWLDQPAAGGFYSDQLNVVRSLLHEEIGKLTAQYERTRTSAHTARTALAASASDDTTLAAAASKIRELTTAAASLRSQQDQLRRRVEDYRGAAQLLGQAVELRDEKLAALGEPVTRQRAALEAWAREITGMLSAERIQALSEGATWASRFAEIKSSIVSHERSLRETFDQRQRALHAILAEQLHAGDYLPPEPLTFNPMNPDESYRLLTDAIREALQRHGGKLSRRLKSTAEQARSHASPEKLARLPADEREQWASQMRDAEARIQVIADQVASALATLIERVADGEPAALANQARQIALAAAPADDLFTRVQVLLKRLQSVALTPDENAAFEVLASVAKEDEVDFAEFERRVHTLHPQTDPWTALRSLARKSRVRVSVHIMRG